MKRVLNALGATLCAGMMLATIGCDHIRDYSVNSYQGAMPMNEYRPAAMTPGSRNNPQVTDPKPSVPTPAPAAAPAAGGESAATKPLDSSK